MIKYKASLMKKKASLTKQTYKQKEEFKFDDDNEDNSGKISSDLENYDEDVSGDITNNNYDDNSDGSDDI